MKRDIHNYIRYIITFSLCIFISFSGTSVPTAKYKLKNSGEHYTADHLVDLGALRVSNPIIDSLSVLIVGCLDNCEKFIIVNDTVTQTDMYDCKIYIKRNKNRKEMEAELAFELSNLARREVFLSLDCKAKAGKVTARVFAEKRAVLEVLSMECYIKCAACNGLDMGDLNTIRDSYKRDHTFNILEWLVPSDMHFTTYRDYAIALREEHLKNSSGCNCSDTTLVHLSADRDPPQSIHPGTQPNLLKVSTRLATRHSGKTTGVLESRHVDRPPFCPRSGKGSKKNSFVCRYDRRSELIAARAVSWRRRRWLYSPAFIFATFA